MTQPKTICQYREFFDELGVPRSYIKEQFGDLRYLATWQAAYDNYYTYPELPLIKYLNEAIHEENNLIPSEPVTISVVEVSEVALVSEVVQSSSTLEPEQLTPLEQPPVLKLPSFNRENKSKFNYFEVLGVDWGVVSPPLPSPTKVKAPPPLPPPTPYFETLTLIGWVGFPMKINFQLGGKCVGGRSPPSHRS